MSTDPKKPTQKFVAIIGAGISGIIQGSEVHRQKVCRRPEEEMVIFEKASGFGGVWHVNTYPGAACDIVSHIYSVSWFPKHDWSRRYSPQDEIRRYYNTIAHHYSLEKSTQFRTFVKSAHWSDSDLLWHICAVRDDIEYFYTSSILISCIGQLNRPKRAPIPGASLFTGPQFHTADWDHSIDLTSKRVAVIGTGPSAGQVVPSIAPIVKELHVFQRSPPHILPRDDYIFSPLVKNLFRYVPGAQWLHHLYLYYDQEMGPYRSVHYGTKEHIGAAQASQDHMERQIPPERQDLRDKFTPDYPFGCKRPLFLDNYYPTFLRSNVHLHTMPPIEISETAVQGKEVDIIIWATGFQTQDLLGHVDVRGHGGVRLKEQWGDTAQAYLGTTVHGFPNLFFVYGAGTGLLWGSLTFMFETQALWNVKMMKAVYAAGRKGIRVGYAVREEREEEYNQQVQEKFEQLALGSSKCTSFYKNSKGMVTTNFPWRLADYWWRLLWIKWGEYEKWEKTIPMPV
ncbi:hypothetical protein FPQ18DRAFT_128218 [Pyronema domesticum]|uniref:Similar to 4-hydroxyacetophenone monooxygenase acc. no. Q93TJ5 n=1 Tax=Pyronema omphalodes (strain CBS 100304) TaxID=1076935 RepID=U4L8W1_PYROM|nr:hypothetical protein FPQ18DRAFT_128218 [Pyronema domesticum]CCX15282.1 Similar to 4-hydroxyacetophenone monooxygenase; acc. no. Q93TJ5 [Pyronema omphalodes CBS 100304]